MKQKLKQSLDKVKKPTLTKCVKMSNDEIENIKNGIINGESLINQIQHQRELQSKLKGSNSNQDFEIVGGRLKFYKDGKFILELARSREGDKSGWISVPRKTFWPPTITSNPGIIQSHDSSTPVSLIADSDNNSSIPSSPWQRDSFRKSSHPRKCTSYELSFTFYRPKTLTLQTKASRQNLKHRRPFHEINNGNVKFIKCSENVQRRLGKSKKGKLAELVEKLSKKLSITTATTNSTVQPMTVTTPTTNTSPTALNGNNNNRNVQSSKTYSLANHIANAISSQPHQHVSPRKRILRELEKVSLEDIKCSRPKTINGNSSSITSATSSPPMPPVSRPISSYSITSLLAHKTNNNNNNINNNNNHNNNDNNHENMSDSAASQSEKSSSVSQQHSPASDSPMQTQMRTPPSSNGNSLHSPIQSSSDNNSTHHAFHKYHPVTRGSPSPSHGNDSNHSRTTGNYSPSLNYSIRESSSSPNTEKSSSSNRNTPPSSGRTIRTLPKKTAALRQQFSSPTMENNLPQASIAKDQPTPMITNERDKPETSEQLFKPSAFVPPHLSYPPQLYPPMNYLSQAYFAPPQFYDPALMVAAAAAYRFQPGVQPAIPFAGYPSPMWPMSPAQFPGPLPPTMIANEQRHSPTQTQFKSSYVPNSPWNPNMTSNHNLIDKSSIEKSGNEANSDVPLNLSKH